MYMFAGGVLKNLIEFEDERKENIQGKWFDTTLIEELLKHVEKDDSFVLKLNEDIVREREREEHRRKFCKLFVWWCH